jgi:hypothetical protein
LAGALAQKHGLAVTMRLATAGSGQLFLVTLFLRETGPAAMLAISPAFGASLSEQPDTGD